MIQFQENARKGKRTDEWKDGQTLFCRTLPATARVPISGKYKRQRYGT